MPPYSYGLNEPPMSPQPPTPLVVKLDRGTLTKVITTETGYQITIRSAFTEELLLDLTIPDSCGYVLARGILGAGVQLIDAYASGYNDGYEEAQRRQKNSLTTNPA
jgi:hypothetical protein